MKTLLFLALSFPALALSPEEPGVQFFSLCGSYDTSSRSLELRSGEKIEISQEAPSPESNGDFCFRGSKLHSPSRESAPWEFSPLGFSSSHGELRYPVMICSVLVRSGFQTLWNGETLKFRGPYPERSKEFGWCADGTSLPVKKKKSWHFNSDRFREMPDPNQRSGMSIGNQ